MKEKELIKIELPLNNKIYTMNLSRVGITKYYDYVKMLNTHSTSTNKHLYPYVSEQIKVDDSDVLVGFITTNNYELTYIKDSIGRIDRLNYIRVDKEYADKITLVDSNNQRYSIIDIFNKMEIMGVKRLDNSYFSNLVIYDKDMAGNISIKHSRQYDYVLSFRI